MDANVNDLNLDPDQIQNDADNVNEMVEDDDSANNNADDDVIDGGVADSLENTVDKCPVVSTHHIAFVDCRGVSTEDSGHHV